MTTGGEEIVKETFHSRDMNGKFYDSIIQGLRLAIIGWVRDTERMEKNLNTEDK